MSRNQNEQVHCAWCGVAKSSNAIHASVMGTTGIWINSDEWVCSERCLENLEDEAAKEDYSTELFIGDYDEDRIDFELDQYYKY